MNGKLALTTLIATLLASGCATTQDTAPAQPSATPAAVVTPSLTGEEIKALISGRTAEGRNSDGYYVKAYNTPDGKISATAAQGGKTYQSAGTWEIKGNTVCASWANKDWKPSCSTLTRIGESYLIKPTVSSVASMPAAKYVDGNPYNL